MANRIQFTKLNQGDTIMLPNLSFEIESMTPVESQSRENMVRVKVNGVNDPFRGVRGTFLILESDKVVRVNKNSLLNRWYRWWRGEDKPKLSVQDTPIAKQQLPHMFQRTKR